MIEKNILKGCGKKFTRNKYTGFCGALRGINPIYYCDKCIGKLEGYQLAQKENQEAIDDFVKKYELLEEAFYDYRKETTEKVEKLKEYFNCSPLECEKIDKIFADTETKQILHRKQ